MPLTCPVCRAGNDKGPDCRRCKADLSLLFAIERQREVVVASARAALAQGRFEIAFDELGRAGELRHGPDLLRLEAILSLVKRDFAGAFERYSRVQSLVDGQKS